MSNRRKIMIFLKNVNQNQPKLNLLLVLILFLGIGLACSSDKNSSEAPVTEKTELTKEDKPRRLDSYTIRGFKFSYYLVPKHLNRDELIVTAQEVHNSEPDTQLVLVDDESQVADYIAYAKEMSKGNMQMKLPKQWADEHIVGNVQKYLSGKWMLCEGNGYREIAELK